MYRSFISGPVPCGPNESVLWHINIGKGRRQDQGRSFKPLSARAVPKWAEQAPPIVEKKQAGFEIVGLSCQCSVLVRSGLDS
jgi:hypothetical protein